MWGTGARRARSLLSLRLTSHVYAGCNVYTACAEGRGLFANTMPGEEAMVRRVAAQARRQRGQLRRYGDLPLAVRFYPAARTFGSAVLNVLPARPWRRLL